MALEPLVRLGPDEWWHAKDYFAHQRREYFDNHWANAEGEDLRENQAAGSGDVGQVQESPADQGSKASESTGDGHAAVDSEFVEQGGVKKSVLACECGWRHVVESSGKPWAYIEAKERRRRHMEECGLGPQSDGGKTFPEERSEK